MTRRLSRGPFRRAGVPRAAAIAMIAATILVTGPAVPRASAQDVQEIPVIQIKPPAQIGVSDTTLAQVAQLTLGNPGLANEIFALNVNRPQQVGGTLTSLNQQLQIGWVLELPQGASGPLVQFISAGGSAGSGNAGSGGTGSAGSGGAGSGGTGSAGQPGAGSGSSAAPPQKPPASAPAAPVKAAREVTIAGLRLPIVLAVIGGLLVLGLTLLIVLRRRSLRPARMLSAGRRLTAWLAGPSLRRREKASRAALSRAWHADSYSAGLARTALAEAAQAIPPAVQGAIAADVRRDSISVLPVPALTPPQPWQARPQAPGTWIRPSFTGFLPQVSDALCRPVRVGGDHGSQLFVDISHCDGAIALTGNPAAASGVLLALLGELRRYHPDLKLAVLGTAQLGLARANLIRDSRELAALISPAAPPPDSPVKAAAARRPITGVVAVPRDAPPRESAEVARLCGLPGSTWLALIAGDAPGAHWHWDVDRAGRMRLPALCATVTAPQ